MKFNLNIDGKGKHRDLTANVEFECEASEFIEIMKADKETLKLLMSIFEKKMDQKREELHYNIESLRRENEELKAKAESSYTNGYNDGYESGHDDAIIRRKATNKVAE